MNTEVVSLEEATRRIERTLSGKVAAFKKVENNEGDNIRWEPTHSETASLQKQDAAIPQVFQWAELTAEKKDMPAYCWRIGLNESN